MENTNNLYPDLITKQEMGPKTRAVYDFLTSRVIGQERAARRVAQGLSISNSGLKDPRKPIGVYLFSGPTGTGKTMTAEVLARCLIGDIPNAPLTRIPCPKYAEAVTLSTLTGASPNYVGYDQPALLKQEVFDNYHFEILARERIREIREKFSPKEAHAHIENLRARLAPYSSLILFDEIEKAHKNVWNLLLNITGDGTLAMNDGSTSEFGHSVIVLTCNVGGQEQQDRVKRSRLGFGQAKDAAAEAAETDQELYELTLKRIEETFPPEFIGRIKNSIVVFRHPTVDDVRRALLNHYETIRTRLNRLFEQDPVTLEFSEGYTEYLVKEGYNRRYGMRPLDQAVQRHCLLPLAVALESNEIDPGDKIQFTIENGEVRLRRAPRVSRPKAPEPTTESTPFMHLKPLLQLPPIPPKKPDGPDDPKDPGEEDR